MLQQKQESKRLMKEWEAQEQRKKVFSKHPPSCFAPLLLIGQRSQEEELKKQQEKQEQEVFEFTKTDNGLLPQKIRVFRAGGKI
jgi:hypothetical protein